MWLLALKYNTSTLEYAIKCVLVAIVLLILLDCVII
jgi:hypothetical protein